MRSGACVCSPIVMSIWVDRRRGGWLRKSRTYIASKLLNSGRVRGGSGGGSGSSSIVDGGSNSSSGSGSLGSSSSSYGGSSSGSSSSSRKLD